MLKVRVRDFQSIADATVEIAGFTVLTGPNNRGKSALFRAIRGVFTNPAPTFVRHGAKHATVEIWDADKDLYVRWMKGSNQNSYLLKVGEAEQKFEKPGSAAPPEVLTAFGVGSIQVGSDKVWPQFSAQFPGPIFLLDKAGSAIADAVANVEHIRKLNKAIAACESDRRSAVRDLKIRRKDQDSIDVKLQQFAGLDDATQGLEGLQEKQSGAERLRIGHGKLVALQRQYLTAKRRVDFYSGFRVTSPPIEGVEKAARELAEITRLRTKLNKAQRRTEALQGLDKIEITPEERVTALRRLREGLGKLRMLSGQMQSARRDLQVYADCASLDHAPSVDSLVKTADQVRKALKLVGGLRHEIASTRSQVKEYERELAEKRQELEDLQESLSEKLADYDACPLCGVFLEEEHESIACDSTSAG